MSYPEGPHRPFFPIGNPFKLMIPRGSNTPSRVVGAYEKKLAERLHHLKPNHADDVVSFSWMKSALVSISETLQDVRRLIVDLELPICSWDIKWVDLYLDNSLKLLDFGTAYGAEVVSHRFGYVMLKCALLDLDSSPKKLTQASLSLHKWSQYQSPLENPNLQQCGDIICKLEETLNLPKIKNTPKAKDLVRAMYGLKVQTIFIFRVFVAAFSSSPKVLVDLPVPKQYLWEEAFTDLQGFMNRGIRRVYATGGFSPLKELRTVEGDVKKLYPLVHDGLGDVKTETFETYCLELMKSNEKFLMGLDDLKLELDRFFKVVVSGRMALLDNFQQPPPRNGVQQVRM